MLRCAAANPVMLTFSDILAARERLAPFVPLTPLRNYPSLDQAVGAGITVFVKHENHLPTNSFKYRNGLAAMTALTPDERARGVIATTLGNHGQGVAVAARMLGVKATIFVPRNNNPDKNAAIRDFGAELVEVGDDYSETIRAAELAVADTGRVFVHSFTNPTVVAGAATVALEMLEQQPDLDALVLSVGGGSHAVGAILVARAVKPDLRIYGVQAAGAPAVHDSWHAGTMMRSGKAETFADGIRVSAPAGFGFPILQHGLSGFVTVSDQAIAQALRNYLRCTHNLCEGAGAAGLAGLCSLTGELAGRRVGLVLTGSNIDRATLSAVLAEHPL
jgi:threonine dehydratase